MDLLWPIVYGIFAGVVAILITMAVEKFGGVVGGALGGTPTTAVPSAIGIIMDATPAEFREAMFSVAIAQCLNTGFLFVWKFVPSRLPEKWNSKKKVLSMIPISLGFWFLAAAGLLFAIDNLKKIGIRIEILGVSAWLFQLCVGSLDLWFNPVPAPKGTAKVGFWTLLSRGVVAGFAIFVSVLIAKIDGNAAGFATAFPAIFLTTMVSVGWSQGEAVSTGAIGPLIMGSLSVPAFTSAFTFYVPSLGIPLGAVLAHLTAILCVTIPVVVTLRWCNRREERLRMNKITSHVLLEEHRETDTVELEEVPQDNQLEEPLLEEAESDLQSP